MESSFRFTKGHVRAKAPSRVLWDLPDLVPIPENFVNGYDPFSAINRNDASRSQSQGLEVDSLTRSVADLKLTTNVDVTDHSTSTKATKTPTDLNALIGKGFSLESFVALLQDDDIFKLESHFKWILQLVGPDGPLDVKRITTLQDKMFSWVEESDEHLTVFQTVAQKLLLATYSGFLAGENGDVIRYFDEAQVSITKAREDPEETSIEQLRVYRYIKLCDQLLISQCSALLGRNTDQVSSDMTIENLRATVASCDMYNQNVFCDNASEATLCGMKGFLANQLGLASKTVELFQQAVKLNPSCYDWQHHLYTSLRKSRREGHYGAAPSSQELGVCLKANQLRPNCWVSLLALANLYQDINKAKKPQVLEEQRHDNEARIIAALTKARELAPNNVSVNLKLAEAYSDLKNLSSKDWDACKSLFEYCENNWPKNSQVYHKIGKFYNRKDTQMAENYFRKSLEVDATNFPCLHDYLRLKFGNLNGQDAVELIDKFLPAYKYKKTFLGKLCAMKGYILWQINEKANAVRSWITGFEKVEGDDKKLLDSFYQRTLSGFNESFYHSRFEKFVIDFNEIRQQLDDLSPDDLVHSVPDVETRIEYFLAFLDDHAANNHWRSNNRYRLVSTSSSVGIEAVDWRSQNSNGKKNGSTTNQQEHQNGLGGGDGIWRRRTTTDPSSGQTALPVCNGGQNNRNRSKSRHNNEEKIEKSKIKSAAMEDMDWRRRDENNLKQNPVSRDVVFKDKYDLQITVNSNGITTNGIHQPRAFGAEGDTVDHESREQRKKDHSNTRNGIRLDNHGRWEHADLDTDLRNKIVTGRLGRMKRCNNTGILREYNEEENWR